MVEEPNKPEELKKSDFEKLYRNLVRKHNDLCTAIDDAGYQVTALGKLNRVKETK